jgi:hypothetical protein
MTCNGKQREWQDDGQKNKNQDCLPEPPQE